MSRSSELVRLVAASLAATLLAVLAGATPTTAQPVAPTPGPVAAIQTPIVDIRTGTGSLDGAAATEETARGSRTRLDSSVLFARDSARLRPRARAEIRRVASQYRADGPGRITVTGYTDDLGSAAHGLRLSKRRAAAVARELDRHLGKDWPAIKIVGRGEADPAVPNTSEANRKLNRRVMITVRR